MTGAERGVEFGQPPGGWGPPPGGAPPGGWGPPGGPPPGAPPGGAPPGGWGPPPGGPPGGGWGPPGRGAPPGNWGPPPGGAPPGAPGGWGPPPGGPPQNPWGPAYPQQGGQQGGYSSGSSPGGSSSPFSPGDAISFAWERVKTDPGTILATIIVGFVAMFIVQFICSFVAQLVAAAAGGLTSAATRHTGAVGLAVLGPLYYAMLALGQLVNLIVSSFFVAGLYRFALKVAKGEPYSFNDLFSAAPLFLSVLVANLAIAVAVGIGCIFLIIPGVIIGLGLSMTLPLIVDRGLGPVEALTASWKLTDGHKLNLLIFAIIAVALSVAGACACGVGILLVLPIIYIAQMYIYLKLTGQPVARVGQAV